MLDNAAQFWTYPQAVHAEDGLEFTSHAFMGWALAHNICHILIEPSRAHAEMAVAGASTAEFRDE